MQGGSTVAPRKPDWLTLRDKGRIRPVAPFVEIWCVLGAENDQANWTRQPLTGALLAAEGLGLAAVSVRVTAMNCKASRRPGPALRHLPAGRGCGRRPCIESAAGQAAMIPAGRFIPLGSSVQMIRPKTQPDAGAGVL
ncbi:hypothetical protein CNY89_11930 [Amaricoccus sp. HAR-UPW-R2A-40]|nr:hypothetical protein CNY89_11930 [Amaricoccus sp. HAR-UPW-R2A-40]